MRPHSCEPGKGVGAGREMALGHLVAWALDSAVDSLSVAALAEHVAGLQKLLPPSPRADDAEPPSGVGAQTAELGTNRARAETARTAAKSSAVVLTRNPVRARQPPVARSVTCQARHTMPESVTLTPARLASCAGPPR
eukprot:COSAG01_NODE_251_length_20305_cov_5.846447_24_plen_138_part_00